MRTFLVAGLLALHLLGSEAQAVLMTNGSNDADYLALGSQLEGKLMWISCTVNGFEFYASAIRFNSEYALTSAHVVLNPLGPVTVNELGTGSNFLSNRGTVRTPESVLPYPTYVPTDSNHYQPDIAIIKFSEPLPGDDLSIGSVAFGDVVVHGGFGSFGTPATGLSGQDGNSRGWKADITNILPIDSITGDDINLADKFGFSTSPPLLNGRASGGDSGGPVFNSNGELVGELWGGSLGTDDHGLSIFLRLWQPTVKAWISQNTAIVPEPSAVILFACGGIGILLRFRHHRCGR